MDPISQCGKIEWHFGMQFVHMCRDDPRFFGFSEFLTALALMLVIWTISDFKYKFRMKISNFLIFPLDKFTFFSIFSIGIGCIFSDYWRSSELLLPYFKHGYSNSTWQFLSGIIFLIIIFIVIHKCVRSTGRVFGKNVDLSEIKKIIYSNKESDIFSLTEEISDSFDFIFKKELLKKNSNYFLSKWIYVFFENKPRKKDYDFNLISLFEDTMFCDCIAATNPDFIRKTIEIFPYIESEYDRDALMRFYKNVIKSALLNKKSFIFYENPPRSKMVTGNTVDFFLRNGFYFNLSYVFDLERDFLRKLDNDQFFCLFFFFSASVRSFSKHVNGISAPEREKILNIVGVFINVCLEKLKENKSENKKSILNAAFLFSQILYAFNSNDKNSIQTLADLLISIFTKIASIKNDYSSFFDCEQQLLHCFNDGSSLMKDSIEANNDVFENIYRSLCKRINQHLIIMTNPLMQLELRYKSADIIRFFIGIDGLRLTSNYSQKSSPYTNMLMATYPIVMKWLKDGKNGYLFLHLTNESIAEYVLPSWVRFTSKESNMSISFKPKWIYESSKNSYNIIIG